MFLRALWCRRKLYFAAIFFCSESAQHWHALRNSIRSRRRPHFVLFHVSQYSCGDNFWSRGQNPQHLDERRPIVFKCRDGTTQPHQQRGEFYLRATGFRLAPDSATNFREPALGTSLWTLDRWSSRLEGPLGSQGIEWTKSFDSRRIDYGRTFVFKFNFVSSIKILFQCKCF